MISRWGVVTVLVMLLAAVLVFEPATAVQRWSPLQMSRDGRTWSSTMTQPLFAAPVVLAPGTPRDASFFVRNSSTDVARLTLQFVVGGDPAWWAGKSTSSPDQVRIYLGTNNSRWHQVMARGALAPALKLRPGVSLRFRVRVVVPRGASNAAKKRSMNFAVRLRLTQQRKGG